VLVLLLLLLLLLLLSLGGSDHFFVFCLFVCFFNSRLVTSLALCTSGRCMAGAPGPDPATDTVGRIPPPLGWGDIFFFNLDER
jgi:hypothetical protein